MKDFGLLKRILRYLKGTLQLGLHIRKDKCLSLLAYCDRADCQETRRSTTGFCTFLGPNLISLSAKRQETVSRSSTEAEYRALAATAQELHGCLFFSGIWRYLSLAQRCFSVTTSPLCTWARILLCINAQSILTLITTTSGSKWCWAWPRQSIYQQSSSLLTSSQNLYREKLSHSFGSNLVLEKTPPQVWGRMLVDIPIKPTRIQN